MILEYLKKNRNTLIIKTAISATLLSSGFLLGLTSKAVMGAFLSLMAMMSPVGIAFFMFFSVLMGGMLGAALWSGLEYGISQVRHYLKHNDKPSKNLLQEDVPNSSYMATQSIVEAGNISTKNYDNLAVDDDIENFCIETKETMDNLHRIILEHNENTEMLLKSKLAEIKKNYHRLALKYHPDKDENKDSKIVKTKAFQKINEVYKEAEKKFDQLKTGEHVFGKSESLLSEQNELLKKYLGILKNHFSDMQRELDKISDLKLQIEEQNKNQMKELTNAYNESKNAQEKLDDLQRNRTSTCTLL